MFPQERDKSDVKKVIFTGLDNCGKTTIITSLRENMARIVSLQPTTGVEYKDFRFLGHDIVTHDLGGQKKYLINYLRNPAQYYDATDICVYVIDVQDVPRYDETRDYFKDALDRFIELGITPFVFVLFHKAENSMMKGDEAEINRLEQLKNRLVTIADNKFPVEFFSTTIYDKWSITYAFSQIFRTFYPTMESMTNLAMKGLVDLFHIEGAVLVDAHGILMGSDVKNPGHKDILVFLIPSLFYLQQTLTNAGVNLTHLKFEVNDFDYCMIEMKEKEVIVHVCLVGARNSLPTLENINQLSNMLPELLISLGIRL